MGDTQERGGLSVNVSEAFRAAARANGRLGGRPPALSPDDRLHVHQGHRRGARVADLARAYRVGRATIYRALMTLAA